MILDLDRLAEVLSADYTYYSGPEPQSEIDDRLVPAMPDLIGNDLSEQMEVLDIGCGDGATLLRHADRYRRGVGIDDDVDHLKLALDARGEQSGRDHVEFLRMDINDLPSQPWEDRFDLVFSERGPVGYDVRSTQAALHVVKPGGLLFVEVIGDLHHQEVREVFGGIPRLSQLITVQDQVRVAFERAGVDIRSAGDLVTKRYYPDIYQWLKFQCSIWAWSGREFPRPDDPQLALFADRNTDGSGRIATTHHVVRVGGVKRADGSPYGEFQHWPST